METVLEINNLTKVFGKITAVDSLSFSVNKGDIYGILGPNGSGKSTTLGMVLNVVNPTSGSWKWFGEEPQQEHLKRIGAIIERPNFYPYLTATQNLKIVAKIKNANPNNIEHKLRTVGLFDRKDSVFSTYSLGMKQRLAIAAALLNDPEILLLDEPTNGLDPQGIRDIRDIIRQIATGGTTILLASHLLDEVEKVCSHVVVIKNGKKLYSGKVDEMTASYGYIEVNADNRTLLLQKLGELGFTKIQQEKDCIKLILESETDTRSLNETLFKSGVTLTHLVKRKNTLEEQFIELTGQKMHA
ncbi:MAG TPA: ABC transporter ATP-binding protein [Saprospiraceae bacterium]|nr:ABC transporter ATP-binding protein [Saprospiraceae bacterium]MCC6688985.1 ABC transporter ATP-binding protein [Saprospiraceae bacterium]HMV23799.1 ABC transporter ATP-binding protein [Saprospiraceae bacterium]HMW74251.1 ABC transporter ATP-binding protein [Saprospiraceae bacterium]HMX82331.1 ABC transporter ATP-binding protein [Saprospiraceae bacterium]